jgi:hypothetical protein
MVLKINSSLPELNKYSWGIHFESDTKMNGLCLARCSQNNGEAKHK